MADPTLVTDVIKAYWTFDASPAGGNDTDLVSGHVMTDQNTAGRVAGKHGNALSAPGGTKRMYTADHTDFETSLTPMSVVFWLHCTSKGGGDAKLAMKGISGGNLSVNINYNTSGNSRAFRSTNGTDYNHNTASIGNYANGSTHLCSYGHAGSTAWFGHDLSIDTTVGTTEYDSAQGWYFGDSANFDGWIDEVMFFQVDVRSAILAEIYNSGAGHPSSYYYPSTTRGSATFFSLASSVIPAATLAGLFAKGAVAL